VVGRASPAPRLHPGAVRLLALLAIGLVVRLVLAFAFFGNGDLFGFHLIAARIETDGLLDVYGGNLEGEPWNYLPAYLPWLPIASGLADVTGAAFESTVQLLSIAADVALAAAVWFYLGMRGASERVSIAGFAAVIVGPAFIATSGYHGQIDAVAILPAVLALIVWERGRGGDPSVRSGVLVGLGAAVKAMPGLTVLPLAASARTWGQRARLIVPAVAVPVGLSLPFYLAQPEGFRTALEYNGIAGRGGLSLVLDPGFAFDKLGSAAVTYLVEPTSLAVAVSDASALLLLMGVALLTVFLFRYRPAPVDGLVLLWITVFIFNPNFFLHYLVWLLPFAIMAGWVAETMALQIALIPSYVILYANPGTFGDAAWIYVVELFALWLFWLLAAVILVRRIVARGPQATEQRPLRDLAAAAAG
jgi:hypothetical protein